MPLRPQPPSDSSAPPREEIVASRYRVQSLLGVGGMGCVYKVLDEASGKLLALKRLSGSTSGEAERLRFRREFHTLAQLQHPGVVKVFEYGLDADGPFYTMELLEGEDLAALGVLSPERTCRVLREVAETLAFLHTRRLLHRDLAPRNIRFDAEGHARLIDFGILATVGMRGDAAGTPPFMAPESLRGLPLDPRTDLFGLGALAYRLLTGRNAYPAKLFRELELLWTRPLAPPSRVAPHVPPALDALVLSLLNVDPLLRPRSAADVIDALGTLEGGGAPQRREAAEGYLASAALIGRRRELEALRGAVKRAVAGEGEMLLVEGPLGSGKSRLLRELGLEARLGGAVVVEARAAEVERRAYAAAREFLRELIAHAPDEARAAAASLRGDLAQVPEVAEWLGIPRAPAPADPAEARARLHSVITVWLLEISERRPLVVLLDDAHMADEGSLGLLSRLAEHVHRHRLVIALGRSTDQPSRARRTLVELMRQSKRLRLGGLAEEDVAELVRATFGEVPDLPRLSRWMHGVAGGSPLHTLELARHLVAQGVLRYENGLWHLADDRLEKETPRALPDSLQSWLSELPLKARALAEALSVRDGELTLPLCLRLADGDEQATFGGLDELVRREVLVGSGDTFRFRHAALRDAVRRGLSPERERALHLTLARALQELGLGEGREAVVGLHLVRGGEPREGARLLEAAGRKLFHALSLRDAMELLQAALEAYEQAGAPPRTLLRVRFRLLVCTSGVDSEQSARYAQPVVDALLESAGLSLARKLAPKLGRVPALVAGVGAAFVRWPFAVTARKLAPPIKALTMLPVALDRAAISAYHLRDLDGLRRWIALAEFVGKASRGLPKVYLSFLRNFLDYSSGDWKPVRARARMALKVLERAREPAHLRDYIRVLKAGLQLQLALTSAGANPDKFAEEIAAVEQNDMRIFDSYVALARAFHHRLRGEEDVARQHDARADAALVQIGAAASTAMQRPVKAALAYAWTRDTLGLRRAMDELGRLSRAGGQVDDVIDLIKGEYHRERGEHAEATAAYLRVLAPTPDRPLTRRAALVGLAETHLARGEAAEALARAREATAAGRGPEAARVLPDFHAERALALAEAETGDVASAARRLEALLTAAERLRNPLLFGTLHEAGALVARRAGDDLAYRQHTLEMERWFGATRNPVLLARAQRLQAHGAAPAPSPAEGMASEAVTRLESHEAHADTQDAEQTTAEPLAQALERLVAAAEGVSGFLYRLEQGRGVLVASRHGEAPPDTVDEAVQRMAEWMREGARTPIPEIHGPDGASWQALLLEAPMDSDGPPLGLAVLRGGMRLGPVPEATLREVSQVLRDAPAARAALVN